MIQPHQMLDDRRPARHQFQIQEVKRLQPLLASFVHQEQIPRMKSGNANPERVDLWPEDRPAVGRFSLDE